MIARKAFFAIVMSCSAVTERAIAETVYLQCSGTFSSNYGSQPIQAAVKDETVTVDFDNNQVSGFYPGVYPIKRVDDKTIVFSTNVSYRDNLTVSALGNIDRITGKTMIFATESNRPGQAAFIYDLMCYPKRRLF